MKVTISNQSKIGNPSEIKVTNNNNIGRVTFGKVVRAAEVAIGQAVDLNKNGSVDGSVITYVANTDSYILLPAQSGSANAAYAQANAARLQANNAYDEANTKLDIAGGTITGDLTIVGNLTLSQNTTLINVTTLNVADPLIYLAANNEVSDSVDIGFVGGKNTSGTYSHTGLVRHASDQKYYLFDNYLTEPENNVINVANITIATLRANIEANSVTVNGSSVALSSDVANRVLKAGDTMTGQLVLSAPNTALSVTNNVSIGGKLSVGSVNVSATVNVSGNLVVGHTMAIDDVYEIYSDKFQVAGNLPVVIDTFPANKFTTVKYMIQMSSIEGIHATEIFAMQNGLSTYATEYATLVSGQLLGYFTFYLSGLDVVLEFEPNNPANNIIDFRTVRHGITN